MHLTRVLLAATAVAALLLVAAWVAPRASGAAAAWLKAQPVSLRTLRLPDDAPLGVARSAGRTVAAPAILDAGEAFTVAAVLCDAPSGGVITVRLRTSPDGATWSPWSDLPLEVVDEGGAVRAFTDPVWTGEARYVQVRATGSTGSPASLTGVRVVAIDPTPNESVAQRLTGAVRHVAAAVAGVSFDQAAVAASAAPVIVTRAEWGADERLRSGSPSYSPVKMAFVHHTAGNSDYTQAEAPALVRAVYAYHTKSLGWSDIGYNFLVDRFGTVYEGRYGGTSRGVVGAHVLGFNTGSTGVSVMGTYTAAAPPAEAVAALERLLAWKLGVAGLSASGTATLTCGATEKYKLGASVTFPVIAGHRQANYTECPGAAFYPLLPAVRTNVARRMGGSSPTASLSASSALISPNSDGVLDTVEFSVALSAAADWQLVVRDTGGQAVATWSGQGDSATITWDGAAEGGRLPDGEYAAELTAGADQAAATVALDTSAPRLAGASATPLTFSPNGDGQAETAEVTYRPAEACSVRVGILDADGAVVRWLHGWRAKQEQEYAVAWDGRVSSGGSLVAAADGQYRFDVERRDAGGNIARQGIKVLVDRTLGFPAAGPTSFSPNGDGVLDSTKVGFRLTRKASVTVSLRVGDEVVRTLTLGTLAAGKHTAVWDGKAGSGEALASCRPTFTVTAVSPIGESSITRGLVVDLTRPHVYAGSAKAASAGVSTRLGFKVTDTFSAKADVTYTVTDAKGRRVASGHPGKLPTGKGQSVTWRPASRGVYTVTFRAADLAGNREAAPAKTVVTVR
jgi:flagellar hook assembly protein FlgD